MPSGSTVAAANDGVLKDLLTYVAMFLVNSILKQSGIVPSDDATYQVRRMILSAFFIASHAGVLGELVFHPSLVGSDERRAPLKTPAWEATFFTTSNSVSVYTG